MSVVLGADSYYDSLVRTRHHRWLTAIARHHHRASAEKEELEEKETQLKDEQEKLEQANEALEENKSSLSKRLASAQIEDISLLEKQYQSDLAASQQKAKEMEQKIAAAYASISQTFLRQTVSMSAAR